VRNPDPVHRGETKNRIVDKARKLFAQKGFGETSMTEVARACGLTKAGIYYYFKSKEALFEDIVNQGMAAHELVMEKMKETKTLGQSLELFATVMDDFEARPENQEILSILVAEGGKKSRVGEIYHQIGGKYTDRFVGHALEAGLIRSGEEPMFRATLFMFFGTLLHYNLNRTFRGPSTLQMTPGQFFSFTASMVSGGWEKARHGN